MSDNNNLDDICRDILKKKLENAKEIGAQNQLVFYHKVMNVLEELEKANTHDQVNYDNEEILRLKNERQILTELRDKVNLLIDLSEPEKTDLLDYIKKYVDHKLDANIEERAIAEEKKRAEIQAKTGWILSVLNLIDASFLNTNAVKPFRPDFLADNVARMLFEFKNGTLQDHFIGYIESKIRDVIEDREVKQDRLGSYITNLELEPDNLNLPPPATPPKKNQETLRPARLRPEAVAKKQELDGGVTKPGIDEIKNAEVERQQLEMERLKRNQKRQQLEMVDSMQKHGIESLKIFELMKAQEKVFEDQQRQLQEEQQAFLQRLIIIYMDTPERDKLL